MLTAGEQEESESGGSRIVSSHFDAELKTLAQKKKKRERKEIKSRPCKRERNGRRERRKEGEAQNMLALFAYVHPPLFH